ncbi:unnamed protein product [Diamesa serratosioi]
MAFRNFLRLSGHFPQSHSINRVLNVVPSRFSSFRSSEKFLGVDKHPEVEIVQNAPEWKYVEQLLGERVIPQPIKKSEYPSGWTLPNPELFKSLPYYVERTKNFMLPVYMDITFRGQRRITIVRKIEGDIWKLEEELKQMIGDKVKKPIFTQVNEMNRQISFKGDYVSLVQEFLISKGL